jgi:hypothetical protein
MTLKPALPPGQERIVYLTYPLSILLMILSYVLIGVFGWKGSRTLGAWPAVLTGTILVMLALLIYKKKTSWFIKLQNIIGRIVEQYSFLRQAVEKLTRFSWIYDILGWLFKFVGKFVNWFTFLLEGNSGLLWGVVFLVLLVMFIGGRG